MDTTQQNEWNVTVRAPDADECYLIGDFNAWSVPGVRMSRVDTDTWSATVDRSEGVGRVQGVAMRNGRVMRLIQAEVQSAPVRHAIA
ncbi:MAG: hypothetical protein K8S99_00630 [Planctomycetes bacterium]|nr:hypothetical protein [Planctomycetota bacterium]